MGLSDRTREAVMEKARSREGKRSDIQREVLLSDWSALPSVEVSH